MVDINGIELAYGDEVVFTMKSYGILSKGIITKITTQTTITRTYEWNGQTYSTDCIIRDGRQIMKLG